MDPGQERKVRQLLNGPEKDRAEALKCIDGLFRHPVCSHIAKRFPGMSIEDLADCWSETLRDIWQASQKRAIDVDTDRPLESFIWKIMYSRAADSRRRRRKFDEIVHEIGSSLRGTSVGRTWGSLDPLERKELLEIIRDSISRLPSRQKMVLQAFTDHFPISMKDLAREVSLLAGAEVTEKAVERALEEGRAKLREAIGRTPYSREVQK